ncbi:protein bem46-like [Iris pallida]|uniref:Protein bem46-like n=1 Tax=Iris pallida TaxID=29817 RepID=A0AAX6GB35_IRIPA|nr:protein bem46-like [Iris pallida]
MCFPCLNYSVNPLMIYIFASKFHRPHLLVLPYRSILILHVTY